MTPERWARIKEIFYSAVERDGKERLEFLIRSCGPDEDLRREVETLLREAAQGVLQSPLWQSDLTGRSITHYRILAKLGQGGMGVVYKAQDVKLGRTVALKFLAPHVLLSEDHRTRLVHEAKALAAIDHPNICAVHEIDEAQGQAFLAMAFVDGPTVKQKIAEGPLDLGEAVQIAAEAARGLQAAHQTGVIHRDIKSANIMLNADGRVVITDFGLAHLEGQPGISQATTLLGTPAYMSPEQLGGGRADRQSDLWALGVVLYEMVSGRLPFHADGLVALALAVHNSEPQPLAVLRSGVPADLDRVVARMLAKSPDKRYQQASELAMDLDRVRERLIAGGEEIPSCSPKPVPVGKQVGFYLARGRWKYAALTVVAAAVMIAAFLTLRSRQEVQPPEPRLAPLTSTAGLERTPALSPDGRQVSFGWNGEREDNFDIYVQLADGGTPRRLTTHPGAESNAVWSPDGRSIAFHRGGSEPGTYLISVTGGSERKLAENAIPNCFTTDGRGLVVEHQGALHLIDMASGSRRQITSAPKNGTDAHGALSPDGRWLAFARGNRSGQWQDVFRAPFPPKPGEEQQPERLTHDTAAIEGLAWTADGKGIVFSSARHGMQALWRVPAFRSVAPQRLEAAGEDAVWPSISRAGNRLVYLHDLQDRDIWRLSVPRRGSRSLWEELSLNGATPLIASTRIDQMAEYSPDGTRIAFASNRSGASEIWVCDAEGRGARMVTSFHGPPAWWPRWSPDGEQLAFFGRSEGGPSAYIVPVQGGNPRLLVAGAIWPSWSRNGRWVYYYSDRSGRNEIWKSLANGMGDPVQVTQNGGYAARESPDGKFLYYLKPGAELWRLPTAGGPEFRVLEGSGLDSIVPASPSMNWAPLNQGVLLIDRAQRALRFFPASAKGQATSREILGIAGFGLSLSPDGRWLLVTRLSRADVDVMLIDNFR